MERSILELEANALNFWPAHIAASAADMSVIPRLIESQDSFISLLHIADGNPFAWKNILAQTSLSANLFLKHLMVLSDIGGEKTQRISKEWDAVCGDSLDFTWKGDDYTYKFQNPKQAWTNLNLKVDGRSLLNAEPLTPMMEDVINFILFASTSLNQSMPQEFIDKCIIGTMIGEKDQLETFVKQRYIWVSRITGGATANDLGNIAQNYVKDYLTALMPDWDFSMKSIPGISQNGRTNTSFDIVAKSPDGKYCAIEASFQVTTNSTIERKAGQAKDRQTILNQYGHKIAYVIDGSGNFTRASALKTICNYSDYVVTYKDEELNRLVEFLKTI